MTMEEQMDAKNKRIEKHKEIGFLFSEKITGIINCFKIMGYTNHDETHYEKIYHLHWTKRIFSEFYGNYTDVWQGKYITIPKYHNRLIRFIFGTRYYQYFYTALDYEGNDIGRYGTDWTKKVNFFDFNGKKGFERYKEGEDYNQVQLEFFKVEYNGWLFGKKKLEKEWSQFGEAMLNCPNFD